MPLEPSATASDGFSSRFFNVRHQGFNSKAEQMTRYRTTIDRRKCVHSERGGCRGGTDERAFVTSGLFELKTDGDLDQSHSFFRLEVKLLPQEIFHGGVSVRPRPTLIHPDTVTWLAQSSDFEKD